MRRTIEELWWDLSWQWVVPLAVMLAIALFDAPWLEAGAMAWLLWPRSCL